MIELAIATEAAFGLAIPDDVLSALDTPRKVINYLESQLEPASKADCLSQLAFHRTRTVAARRFNRPLRSLLPSTPIASLIAERGGESQWKQFGAELGADYLPKWREANCFRRQFQLGPATLGDLSRFLAQRYPAIIKGARGWTSAEIEKAFLDLLVDETGVDLSKFTLDSRFGRDMGME